MRFGPFAISLSHLAVTLSVALHAGLIVGALAYRPPRDEPRMEIAPGELARVQVRLLTPQQVRAMTDPSAEPLSPAAPAQPPDVSVAASPTEPTTQSIAIAEAALRLPRRVVRPLPDPMRPMAAARPTVVAVSAETPEPPPAVASAAPAGVTREPALLALAPPNYPMLSRRLGEEGEVVLSAIIDASGTVTDIRVIRSPGHARLEAAALAALRSARFEPATVGGRPVARRVTVPFHFQLSE